MKVEPLVYIILLNYKGAKDTIECLESLNKINYKNYKIVVVDNDSKDNSEEKIKEFVEEKNINAAVVQSGANYGFSGGNNIGIQIALNSKADYICLINNDTIVEPDFLNHLIKFMITDDSVGLVGGKILYYSEPDIIWSAGGYIKKSRGYHYGLKEKDSNKYNEIKSVTFLTGCLQLIRSDVFRKVGLYSEDYFLYMEDVDFCYRVKKGGYNLMYIPESRIYHKISAATGGENSPNLIYYENRNRMLFNKKFGHSGYKRILFYFEYFIQSILRIPFRKPYYLKCLISALKDHLRGKYGQKIDSRS